MLSTGKEFMMTAWLVLFVINNLIPAKAQTEKTSFVDIGHCIAGAPCVQEPRANILSPEGVLSQLSVRSPYIQVDISPTGIEESDQATCNCDGRRGSVVIDRMGYLPPTNGYAVLQVRNHVSVCIIFPLLRCF